MTELAVIDHIAVPDTLPHFDRARHELEIARSIDEVKLIRDQAEALRQYARVSGQSLDMQNSAAEIKLRAERKAGELLAAMPKHPGAATPSHDVSALPPRLADIGISPMQSSRWQAEALVPEPVFEDYLEATKDAGEEITTAGLLRAADKPHVAHNSGNNEWYTPIEYIDAARQVLREIDLDPASSEQANAMVGAGAYYTVEDDGLTKDWVGRVWMNPPYSSELIGPFTAKLVESYVSGAVSEAIVLVNNATDTRWFQRLLCTASAVCFPERRVRFWGPDGTVGAPLQGQAVLYFGDNYGIFAKGFEHLGRVLRPA